MSKSQNQNLTYPVSSTQFLVNFLLKKISSKTLLFCGYRSQRIFNFDCFSWYHIYIFEKKKKNEWGILIQNLMLNRLALISNPKMKNQKARVPFLIAVFCFEINLIKGFSFFADNVGQSVNFFQVSLKQKH